MDECAKYYVNLLIFVVRRGYLALKLKNSKHLQCGLEHNKGLEENILKHLFL